VAEVAGRAVINEARGPRIGEPSRSGTLRVASGQRALTVLVVAALGLTAINGPAFANRGQPAHRDADIVAEWASAWSGTDQQALAKLFTSDATYTDLAVNVVSVGRDGVASWKQRTDLLISRR
jgi:hypothetical protein